MRTVSNSGIQMENQHKIDYSRMFFVSEERRNTEKSCFYEFAAEKVASFTNYVEEEGSKFISSLKFDSND